MSRFELVVDLRQWSGALKQPADFVALWNRIEHSLHSSYLAPGKNCQIDVGVDGTIGIEVLNGSGAASPQADYIVCGLIERPTPSRRCRLCANEGITGAGCFHCPACSKLDPNLGVCERHLAVLDGAYWRGRFEVSCTEHVPGCASCHSPARFWCRGPSCRGRKAWCLQHGRSHLNSPDVFYCQGCYETLFPQCAVSNCNEPGVNRCEHVDQSSGVGCGIKLCNRHVARWQVYGYEKVGLARCSSHRRIKDLEDDSVVYQIVAGTAHRHLRRDRGQDRFFLPSLGSVKNILIKGRNQFYDEQRACELYKRLQRALVSQNTCTDLSRKMLELISRAEPSWGRDLAKLRDRRSQGEQYLNRLRALLESRGEVRLAQAIVMTDFVPNYARGNPPKPGIFVRVPADLKGRFIGRGGVHIRAYSQQLGCEVEFEREDR